jgi:hypothetical protein
MAKAAFSKKRVHINSTMDVEFRNKLVKHYIWSTAFLWCWKLGTLGSTLDTPGKSWNEVPEEDRDQLDRHVRNEEVLQYLESQGAEEYPTWNKQTEG